MKLLTNLYDNQRETEAERTLSAYSRTLALMERQAHKQTTILSSL